MGRGTHFYPVIFFPLEFLLAKKRCLKKSNESVPSLFSPKSGKLLSYSISVKTEV